VGQFGVAGTSTKTQSFQDLFVVLVYSTINTTTGSSTNTTTLTTVVILPKKRGLILGTIKIFRSPKPQACFGAQKKSNSRGKIYTGANRPGCEPDQKLQFYMQIKII
jgi:hypothetical protein